MNSKIIVPKDIVNSGWGRTGWVECTFFGATRSEVEQKLITYFSEWPSQGYGTSAGTVNNHKNGYYYAHTKRYASCD